MAQFNPDVKDVQPQNYLGWSKPISNIEADKSTGLLLAGAGQDVAAGVELADQSVKNSIQKQLYAQIDPIRDQFADSVSALKPTTTQADPNTLPPTQPNGVPSTPQWAANTWGYTPKAADPNAGPLSLVASSDPDSVPSGISSGLSRVQTLQAAVDGKHISETPYIAQLNAVAKQLRSDYPGYRPYIDQQISNITGFDPANKLVSSIIQDSQNALKNSQTEQEKTMSFIRENAGLESAQRALGLYTSGKINSNQVIQMVGAELNVKQTLSMNAMKREEIKGNADLLAKRTTQDFGSFVDGDMLNQLNTFDLGSGMTPQRLQDIANARAAGQRDDLTDADMARYGILLTSQKASLANKYLSQARQKNPQTGRSVIDDMGGDETAVRTLINSRLGFFDELSQAYSSKDPSAANIHATVAKNILEDQKHSFLNGRNPTLNTWMRASSTINTLAPQLAPDMYRDMQLNNVPDSVKGAVMYNLSDIVAQPTWAEKGQPTSVNSVVGNSLENGITSPSVYESYIGLNRQLADPKTPPVLRRNIAASFFSAPDALQLLTKFQKDYVDSQGNRIPGKYAVYTQLTNPDVTKSLASLRATNPQIWNDYVNWAQESFGNVLFKNEINDLAKLTTNSSYHVAWDSDNHQFILRDQNHNRIDDHAGAISQRYVWNSLSNLNLGLRNLGNIAQANGTDIDAYLLGRLQQMGVRVDKGIDNIPEKIMSAVLNARKDKKNLSNEDIIGIQTENK